MTKPNTSPNANHLGGPSFFPDIKATQVKRPIPPSTVKKKADTQILKDEDIPPL